MKKLIYVLLCVIAIISIYNTVVVSSYYTITYIYPKNKSQCVTIFDGATKRFLLSGKHTKLDGDYVCLDVSRVTELGDAIYVCWQGDQGWEITIPKSKLISNSLDTNLFKINCSLPIRGKHNIPSAAKFNSVGCGTFDIAHKIVSRPSDDVTFEKGPTHWKFK